MHLLLSGREVGYSLSLLGYLHICPQRGGIGRIGYPGWGMALGQSTVPGLDAVGQPCPALWVEVACPT